MKPAAFDFYAPESKEEVLSLLATYGDDARLLAGGQSLVPLMNMRILRPGVIISLNRCRQLAYLREEDDVVVCGAMIRQAEAEETVLLRDQVPLLAAALPYVGVRASRNRGTVCGSLAHADPLAELPSVAAALEATFVINGPNGRREVAADEFFVSELATCIDTGEMLSEVRFPKTAPDGREVFLEVGNRAHGFAVVGIAAYFEIATDNRCDKARLAAMGMGATTVRLTETEQALEGQVLSEEVVLAATESAGDAVDPADDIHASADYRRHLAGVLVKRVLDRLCAPAAQVVG